MQHGRLCCCHRQDKVQHRSMLLADMKEKKRMECSQPPLQLAYPAGDTWIQRAPHLVAVIQDGHAVPRPQQLLSQVQAQEGVAAALGVGNQHRVGAH